MDTAKQENDITKRLDKTTICAVISVAVFLVLIIVLVVTFCTVGAVYAKKNTVISAADAEQIAVNYVSSGYGVAVASMRIKNVTDDFKLVAPVKDSYYEHEVRIISGLATYKVEINGKTGERRMAKIDYDD